MFFYISDFGWDSLIWCKPALLYCWFMSHRALSLLLLSSFIPNPSGSGYMVRGGWVGRSGADFNSCLLLRCGSCHLSAYVPELAVKFCCPSGGCSSLRWSFSREYCLYCCGLYQNWQWKYRILQSWYHPQVSGKINPDVISALFFSLLCTSPLSGFQTGSSLVP